MKKQDKFRKEYNESLKKSWSSSNNKKRTKKNVNLKRAGLSKPLNQKQMKQIYKIASKNRGFKKAIRQFLNQEVARAEKELKKGISKTGFKYGVMNISRGDYWWKSKKTKRWRSKKTQSFHLEFGDMDWFMNLNGDISPR